MNEAARIASVIKDSLPDIKSGTLMFYGDWFGKPYDNYHVIISAEADDDRLTVTFKGNEKLTIFDPNGSRVSKEEFEYEKRRGFIGNGIIMDGRKCRPIYFISITGLKMTRLR